MPSSQFSFRLHHVDALTAARRSSFLTPHGEVQLPAFMPVGTQGTVKGVTASQLRASGAEMVLGNAYHLALRPGADVVRQLGGLHRFMGWDGPILTDSGGFQIFSLAKLTKITEQNATFRSHIDGSLIELSPERAIQIQHDLGSDVAMVLDHVVALPNQREVVADAMQRSIRWAARCRQAATADDQALFAIVQGGLDQQLREQSAAALVAMDFDGFAVGGLSVGESPDEMMATLDFTVPYLSDDRPRYLMGVGRPEDILNAVARGIDLFDCVIPTRNGRNALAFTDQGTLRLRNRCHQRDQRPLDESCACAACRHLRHLFIAGEMLGPTLLSIHNLTYYQRLLAETRQAISEDRFTAFHIEKRAGWQTGNRKGNPAS